jgi:hypothetical protein
MPPAVAANFMLLPVLLWGYLLADAAAMQGC